jgi:two-component system cell cycle sensor histidine kinase/response regulator CckA
MSKTINVLVVEDSENDTQLLMEELRRNGYEPNHRRVQTSADMHNAIQQHKWDVVVSDYTMPQFSGSDALKVFTGLELDIPFIFVSGTHGEDAAVRMMKAGAADYIVKGNIARLVPAIEREMESARARHAQIRAESAMHHLAAIVESSEDAIYGLNLDSTIISWNPAAERICGYQANEIIGRSIAVLFPLNRRDELLETMANIRRGKLAGVYETERRRKDGRNICVSIACSPIKNAEGKTTGASMIARDISRQKQNDEDCLKLIQDLTSALSKVNTLAGLLPICTSCKRIHEDQDIWLPVETYLANKCDATFTQSTCPECSGK